MFFCLPAGFVRCLQPVLVSRKDPDSRKNTIQEIDNRAKSGGHWPQVRQEKKMLIDFTYCTDSYFVPPSGPDISRGNVYKSFMSYHI